MDEADEKYLERVAVYSPEVFVEGSTEQAAFRAVIRKLVEKSPDPDSN